MKTTRLAIVAIAPFFTACWMAVAPVGGVGPLTGPGPSVAGPISAGDAEKIGLRVAADHGYTQAKAEKVHHDEGQGGRWKVEIRGLANGKDGKLDVRIADDGKVVDVNDHQKGDKDDKKEKKKEEKKEEKKDKDD